MVKMNIKRQLTQNRKPSLSQRKPRRRSSKWNIRNSLSNKKKLRKISTRLNPRKQPINHWNKSTRVNILRTRFFAPFFLRQPGVEPVTLRPEPQRHNRSAKQPYQNLYQMKSDLHI
ncbi:Hypothetical_protein [Hexamita inflata]|uniref:Hypothetical_protein n=1 Tax=Hexamita inflata TaxID=28002 RepID=A0AA86TN33_9EUKA|nr:Hypothetical protein HINF_LOCUS8357 [Hexamita inflata]CAI9946257.1 Hypothetical protein HINF_LOCUS33902 [Hexamita inflata]